MTLLYVYIDNGEVKRQEYSGQDAARKNIKKQLNFTHHLPVHVIVDGEKVLDGDNVMLWILEKIDLE